MSIQNLMASYVTYTTAAELSAMDTDIDLSVGETTTSIGTVMTLPNAAMQLAHVQRLPVG